MALRDNMVSWWSMDEASGTRNDSHGTNNLTANGTGGVGSAAGKYSNAADFESGDVDYLSIADASQSGLDLGAGGTDFSLSYWIKFESVTAGSGHTIFAKFQGGGQDTICINFQFNSSAEKIEIYASSNGSAWAWSGATVLSLVGAVPVAGTWYHFVHVYDASAGTMQTYRDGSSVNTLSSGPTSLFNSSAAVHIGTDNGNLDGLLDEYGVWSRTLDSSEVSSLYNSGSGLDYAGTASGGSTFTPRASFIM